MKRCQRGLDLILYWHWLINFGVLDTIKKHSRQSRHLPALCQHQSQDLLTASLQVNGIQTRAVMKEMEIVLRVCGNGDSRNRGMWFSLLWLGCEDWWHLCYFWSMDNLFCAFFSNVFPSPLVGAAEEHKGKMWSEISSCFLSIEIHAVHAI